MKICPSSQAALDGRLSDGMTILSGGFGQTGLASSLIRAIAESGVTGLTVVSNNCGGEAEGPEGPVGYGLWHLLDRGQIRRFVGSYVGGNKLLERMYLEGRVELELVPQGTLAERLRAGGAGIPAFFTPTGVGTPLAEGKRVERIGGAEYLLEYAIRGDLAIVKAWKGDAAGNLVFRKTARNFNPDVAAAGKFTVAEVQELVPVGDLDPDLVHVPGIFVDAIVCSAGPTEPGAGRTRTGAEIPR